MSQQDCDIKNPLERGGTSQEDRLPTHLDPSQLLIDAKGTEELQQFAERYAELIQYYDSSNTRLNDWTPFFQKDADRTTPHLALYDAFLELFRHAQTDLNTISKKHLEFYYQDVLRLKNQGARPDEAHVLFELSSNATTQFIEAGTELNGGKDDTGVELTYTTDKDIVVNKTQISSIRSVYTEKDSGTITQIYAASVANSSDGAGADLDENNPKWAPFGLSQEEEKLTLTLPKAEVGFAIADPILLLKEGERTVTLILDFDEPHSLNTGDLQDSIMGVFSGAEAWVTTLEITTTKLLSTRFQISFTVTSEAESIVGYNEELLAENYDTEWPLLKVLLVEDANAYAYQQMLGLTINKVTVKVDVTEAKDFLLQNEFGKIDPSKPFEPFGPEPAIGSPFYIGSNEVFRKKLTNLELIINWFDVPEENLGNYYNVYSNAPENEDFKVKVELLENRKWTKATDLKSLFDTDDAAAEKTIEINDIAFSSIPDTTALEEHDSSSQNGFLRFELAEPNGNAFKAFGHSQYDKLYVTKSFNMAMDAANGTDIVQDLLPNEPYIPTIKSLSITYTAETEIDFQITQNSSALFENRVGQFFHIEPFGQAEQHPYLQEHTLKLFPQFTDQGTLYIGCEELDAPQNLNLLFQVAEGSSDPTLEPQNIQWWYLVNNIWEKFLPNEVLSDSTNGLINSGIVELSIPKTITDNNTLLPPDVFWIKGSIVNDPNSVCQLISIKPQAVSASFINKGNDPNHLLEPLPAETITKLEESNSIVSEVIQPYASFNGKLKEEEASYYRRVSERLRHKNRAITIWDYERMVLEEFPSIYKVKCLNHTSTNSELAPGCVSLILISNLRNQNAVNILRPTTSISTLSAVEAYVNQLNASLFVTVDARNPNFEEVQLDFKVRFHATVDQGFYENEIHNDIKQYLSPWAYEEGEDISFEGVIHKSKIINFIEELHYVDFVSCFKMHQLIEDQDDCLNINEAKATRSDVILVSAGTHVIQVLTSDDCECPDNENIQTEILTDGIGTMTVVVDFEVNKP